MKLSLRTKLAALLLLTGAAPLLAGLGFMVYEANRIKRDEIGAQYRAMAVARADALQASLHEHLVLIVATARSPFTLEAANIASQIPFDEAAASEIDAAWSAGKDSLAARRQALAHPLAESFRQILQGRRRKELFLTDRQGRVFACGRTTTDYLQADEQWWQRTHNNGEPRVYISPVKYDQSTEAWSIDVCAPLIDTEGRFLGVCKAVVDLGTWVARSTAGTQAGVQQILLDEMGMVVHDNINPPYVEQVSDMPPSCMSAEGDWMFSGNKLLATAAIELGSQVEGLPLESPRWILMLRVDSTLVMSVVRRLMIFIAVIGAFVIAAAFLIGLYSVQGQIVRPIRRLRNAARQIANGDLEHRIAPQEGVDTTSELHELVDDFNQMASAVQKSHTELKLAYDTKNRFIRVAGHELKTPLTYILAMSELLGERSSDERNISAAKSIADRARRLNGIVSGMLKLSAGGFGPSLLELKNCEANAILDKVNEMVQPFISARGQKLRVARPDSPVNFQADEGKIIDAVMNLTINAIKFTPDDGTISLSADLVEAGTLRIAVSDQGNGIPEDEIRHIFEPFWGGSELLQHSSGEFEYEKRGAGLGLPVAKYFVELHAGHIELRSTPAGCVFTILLPINSATATK